MRAAIRRYQRARGLTADGVIGPETLMALSSDQAGPHLLRTLE
jgi:general secretion pathway protein A